MNRGLQISCVTSHHYFGNFAQTYIIPLALDPQTGINLVAFHLETVYVFIYVFIFTKFLGVKLLPFHFQVECQWFIPILKIDLMSWFRLAPRRLDKVAII